MKDLWGNEVPDFEKPRVKGIYKKRKHLMQYNKNGIDRKCKNCLYSIRTSSNTKQFWKCKLIGISESEATDVHANGVCMKHVYLDDCKRLGKKISIDIEKMVYKKEGWT